MKTLALNKDNDIHFFNKGLAMVEGTDCQAVIIDSIIKTQKGEMTFNKNEGIDYFGTVFQNAKYIDVWALSVQERIKKLDWVDTIEKFEYSFDSSAFTVNWSMVVKNTDGETISIGNSRNMANESSVMVNVDWEGIFDKPNNLDESIESFRKYNAAAKQETLLGENDQLENVNSVLENVVQNTMK